MCAGTDELTVVSAAQDGAEDPQGNAGPVAAQGDRIAAHRAKQAIWNQETRDRLYMAGFYPTELGIAMEGREEKRAENTLRVVQGLPFLDPRDLLAIATLVMFLTQDGPTFDEFRICRIDGEPWPPEAPAAGGS